MSKQKDIFIIAQYYAKPRNPKLTYQKGYMDNEANIVWDERIDVTHGLKQKDLLAAKVIINISAQRVEKDGFKSGKSFDELFEYFYTSNPKQISQAIKRFGLTVRKTDEHDLLTDV